MYFRNRNRILESVFQIVAPPFFSTQMTQIKQIFTDRKNLCLSVTSVSSVCLKKVQQFESAPVLTIKIEK